MHQSQDEYELASFHLPPAPFGMLQFGFVVLDAMGCSFNIDGNCVIDSMLTSNYARRLAPIRHPVV
jgi:hypothetical protein